MTIDITTRTDTRIRLLDMDTGLVIDGGPIPDVAAQLEAEWERIAYGNRSKA